MSKIEECDKLDRAIADCTIKLKSIQANVEQIDREINALTPRKAELEQNIEFHKKASTVPIVQEHRKTRSELSKIKARLILITFDRKKSLEACKQIEEIIEKFKRDQALLLQTNENNVVRGLFGAKRGKK